MDMEKMNWFEKLTGFREGSYHETRAQLKVVGDRLISAANGASHGVGTLELASLSDLRARTPDIGRGAKRPEVRERRVDVRLLHHEPTSAGALFQVASQFNLLEMVGPAVTPEEGVTRYAYDPTQGPACAIAAGAATIYRNYFALVGDAEGQTAERQIDALADIGTALVTSLGLPVDWLWTMRNGYALATRDGLAAISRHLEDCDEGARDRLRGLLRIGLHHNVEVTDALGPDRPHVTQAFCSALPVAYGKHPAEEWEPFARLILEAAYEATFRAAVLNARGGGSRTVYLTLLGGGAFGNRLHWIREALDRALDICGSAGLDICMVRRPKVD
jgi:hypothetical protein